MSNYNKLKMKISGEHALLIATFLAGIGWIATKQVLAGIPAAEFLGYRFLFASIILLFICWRKVLNLSVVLFFKAFGVGLLLGINLLVWITGLSYSKNIGEGSFIVSMAMLFAPLLAWLMYKQKPHNAFWQSMPIALTGMGFLSLSGGFSISLDQIYFVGAALISATYLNVNKAITDHIAPLTLVSIQLLAVGGLALIAYHISMYFNFINYSNHLEMNNTLWIWFIVAVVLATSIRYVFQTYGQAHTSTATASLLLLLEPVWTLVMSILFFAEELTVQKIVGCLLIITAQLLYRRKTAK